MTIPISPTGSSFFFDLLVFAFDLVVFAFEVVFDFVVFAFDFVTLAFVSLAFDLVVLALVSFDLVAFFVDFFSAMNVENQEFALFLKIL
ncbi:hypothetical protein Nmar_0856 [Nitrosopumilus maritimus SCM1]|uniref:Uncharacterized protein n=1 Tax=Nitrosopumilus maritimus (strain SCM1) TaxID=436308 RepID=A9A1B7_NITMS|nr:hypothetical protein Nmar_0856 [Nitrosopumilus maritimus SCM1]